MKSTGVCRVPNKQNTTESQIGFTNWNAKFRQAQLLKRVRGRRRSVLAEGNLHPFSFFDGVDFETCPNDGQAETGPTSGKPSGQFSHSELNASVRVAGERDGSIVFPCDAIKITLLMHGFSSLIAGQISCQIYGLTT
jgi:hypothetical protein